MVVRNFASGRRPLNERKLRKRRCPIDRNSWRRSHLRRIKIARAMAPGRLIMEFQNKAVRAYQR